MSVVGPSGGDRDEDLAVRVNVRLRCLECDIGGAILAFQCDTLMNAGAARAGELQAARGVRAEARAIAFAPISRAGRQAGASM
jgi:hypothetical protein